MSASQSRYSKVAMLFHWAIAIAVIANWQIAEKAHELPQSERGELMGLHFTLGITILLLTVGRIVWRLMNPPPPLSPTLKDWERKLAKTLHALFYILLIGLPLGGWIGLSGYDAPIDFWGMFSIPPLPVGFGEETGHELLEVHATIGTAMIVLIGLHILAALKHTILDKDGNLWRMLPFGNPSPRG